MEIWVVFSSADTIPHCQADTVLSNRNGFVVFQMVLLSFTFFFYCSNLCFLFFYTVFLFGVYYLFLFSFISYTFIFKAWSFCDFFSETLVLIPKCKVIALYLFVLVMGIITLMFTTAFKKFPKTFAACLCQHWKPIFQIATPLWEHYFKSV